MAQKVEILSLDIDTQALISKMTQTRAEIDKLKSAQKELTNTNQTNSDAFTKNAVEIGRLQSSYNSQAGVVKQLTTANNAFATATQAASQAIDKEITSIGAARDNNTQLLAIRNQVNTKTDEGKDAITRINAKLDENNNFIKNNVSAYEQQKISIGQYSAGIKDALNNINPLNGGLQGLAQRSEAAGGAGKLLTTSLGGVITGIWGMVTASLAFIATPIGLVVTAIAGAFLILYNIFKNFAPVLNPIKDAFAALGAIFETLKSGIFALTSGAKSLKEVFSGMGSAMADAASEAYKLAAAQRAVTKEQRLLDVATAKATTQIQELILKSKDRTATEAERIAYIDKAQQIEETINARKLTQQNKIIANARLALAEGKQISEEDMIQMAKNNSAFAQSVKLKYNLDQSLIDKLREGEIAKETILQGHNQIIEKSQNRENQLYEKQQAAKEKADKEAADANLKRIEEQAKLVDAAIQKNKDEIDLYIQNQGIKKKSLQDELAFEETILNKKLDVLKQEYDAKKITESKFQVEQLKLKNGFAKLQAEATVANAEKELEDYLALSKSKIDGKKFLDAEMVANEIDRLNKISEAEATAATAKLVAGTVSTEEYNTAIKAIDAKFAADKEAVEAAKIEADKEKKAIDLENKMAADTLASENNFAFRAAEIERDRAAEVEAAAKTGADVGLINEKYAAQKKALDKDVASFKLNQELQLLSGLKGLFGEGSKLGKAAALAEIGITTYTKASAAFAQAALFAANPLTAPLAVNANIQGGIIIATGAMQAAKVAGVKLAKGEVDINGAGTSTSDSIPAMLSKGESVINARGTAMFKPLLQNINDAGLNGTSLSFPMSSFNPFANNVNTTIDYDLLAYKISQANSTLPSPVVSVQDINYTQNSVRVIESGANF